jgi:hypothetical protein
MDADLEEKFEEIAQTAIEEAESVDCSGKDFVEGLKVIASQIRHRLEGAASEFKVNL